MMMKNNYQHFDSDFCRRWVWSMVLQKLGFQKRALDWCGKRARAAEYPAHLGYRLWQDMGRIADYFGDWDSAVKCYRVALRNRPFISFFPMRAKRGFSSLFGIEDTGSQFYLGYWEFFVAGSRFSYAAHWTVATEKENDPAAKTRLGNKALAALSDCRSQGIHPAESLALQGVVHYQLQNFELATAKLKQADQELLAAGHENSEVVKLLAILQFENENFAAGEKRLARYLTLNPDDSSGWQLMGLAQAQQGNFTTAIQNMDQALERDSKSVPAWYNRAVIGLRLGQVEQARDDLAMARQLAPDNPAVVRLTAMIRQDPTARIEVNVESLNLPVHRSRSVRNRPNDVELELNAADLENLLTTLRSTFKTDSSLDNRLALAEVLGRTGAMADVQVLLTPLWPDRINQKGAWLLLNADRSLGQPERAMALANSLAVGQTMADDAELFALVAVTCLENGAEDAGQRALDRALELDPGNEALVMMRSMLR